MKQCDLFRVLSYNPESGEFTWIKSRRHGFSGRKAGSVNGKGYIQICIDGKLYLAHRLALLYVTGEMPKEVDHINRVRDDNRLCNLRPCTSSENKHNKDITSRNKTGMKGVSWHPDGNSWRVRICVNKTQIHLGYYEDIELAELVSQEARIKYAGDFNYEAH